MTRIRRFSSAILLATMLAGGMMVSTATLEAAGKKGGGQDAICQYLKSILEWEYTSPYILVWAQALYDKYCTS